MCVCVWPLFCLLLHRAAKLSRITQKKAALRPKTTVGLSQSQQSMISMRSDEERERERGKKRGSSPIINKSWRQTLLTPLSSLLSLKSERKRGWWLDPHAHLPDCSRSASVIFSSKKHVK